MPYTYPTFICEHCRARVRRKKPLTHRYSHPCPKCRTPTAYYVDNDGNEHPRPPLRPMEEIMEDLAKLGALKNSEKYGYWEWKSKKSQRGKEQ